MSAFATPVPKAMRTLSAHIASDGKQKRAKFTADDLRAERFPSRRLYGAIVIRGDDERDDLGTVSGLPGRVRGPS